MKPEVSLGSKILLKLWSKTLKTLKTLNETLDKP